MFESVNANKLEDLLPEFELCYNYFTKIWTIRSAEFG